ncbi:hypothetical protein F441_22361 [Phytophthora nicotianae CJ01A1]|uniref:Uncharacterized protein n=1 Tax=Phytophthora nicotianae CJ01A1 TaxID=1317063 RepID=W2VS95_PHYNI|nr:hypothetical protein F441_22363 [Phytophthora nicotianae CJ01A1]ETP00219.1 hypothetical protein F441_22361 [Phytophthora nicotianae CJ01A1]
MEETTVPKTFGELLEALNEQQVNFQAIMQQQLARRASYKTCVGKEGPASNLPRKAK